MSSANGFFLLRGELESDPQIRIMLHLAEEHIRTVLYEGRNLDI